VKDFRFRRIERHRIGGMRDRMELSYPVPRSPSGKIDQYSPNADAVPRLFLIGDAPADRAIVPEHRQRIRREPGAGETVCPYSGHVAPDDEFVHFADIEAIKKQVEWEAAADIEDHLAAMAKDFNRRQPRNSFISIKMDFKPSRRPRPLTIREDLLRDLECDVCRRAYAVYAIALFCPDCGAPNLALHFRREVALVGEQIALANGLDASRAELAYRLMGNAHEDVLTAFETALRTVYRHLVRVRLPVRAEALCAKKEIGNAFQNIDRAREKFGKLGIDPFSTLTDDGLGLLRVNIQKRHVIGHNLGVADEHYAELTQSEQPGETVTLIGEETHRFAQLCLQIVTNLESQLLVDRQAAAASSATAPDAGSARGEHAC
jgi:hypothetical protein